MYKDITKRKEILQQVKLDLIENLKEYIVSAVVYGSTMCEDFCDYSDFDILLIINKSTISILNKIRNIRDKYLKRNIILDFNVHLNTEMPGYRKDAFWHNNRGFYIQREIKLYGLQLIGEDLFSGLEPKQEDIKLESVRVINSLLYQARKLLINKKINHEEKIRLMKFCIYAVLYALASKNIYPKTKEEALKIFSTKFKLKIKPVIFLNKKIVGPDKIYKNDLTKAYIFLSELDKELYNQYKLGLL